MLVISDQEVWEKPEAAVANERGQGFFASLRMTIELGIIGLGRMGGNMAERLRLGGHKVVVYDFNAEAVKRPTEQTASSPPEAFLTTRRPRAGPAGSSSRRFSAMPSER